MSYSHLHRINRVFTYSRARTRNIECFFFRFFFTDFQTIKFDEKFYLSRIFAKKYISIEQRFIFIARIISTASLSHLEERKLLLLFINTRTCSKSHFRFILNLFYNDYYDFHFLHYRSYDLYLSKKRKETRRKEKKRKWIRHNHTFPRIGTGLCRFALNRDIVISK